MMWSTKASWIQWPREVFTRVGLFDEELVRNQIEEFNLRLKRKNLAIAIHQELVCAA
jgi:hypothetical protein